MLNKKVSLINGVVEMEIHMENNKLNPYPTSSTKLTQMD